MIKNILKRFMDWSGNAFTYTGNGTGARYARGGYQSTAGPVVNEDTALTIPAFFHALRLYGQTLGSLSWNLIRIDDNLQGDGNSSRSVARDHPTHRLLHDDPNEFQLPSTFRETIVGHAVSWGNGYAYIERNGNFRATAMQPLLPDRTYPIRVGGSLIYRTYINQVAIDLQPYEVFHLCGFGNNGLTGIPVVRTMTESLGLTKAEERFASAFFGNGANAGGIVTYPGRMSDSAIKNARDSLEQNHGGLGNAFKWLFLEEGMTATQLQVDAEKTQLTQSRAFQIADLARIVGLAPHLLFDLSRSTNNNIEHQGIEAVTYSFKPWANKLDQEANRKLLYESEKGIYEAVLDLKPLMQGDAKTQAERDQIRFNCASLTPNEIRAKDGLNPIAGGDQLFINVATAPLSVVIERAEIEMATAKGIPLDQIDDDADGQDLDPASADENSPPQTTAEILGDGPAVEADMVEDANAIATPYRSALRPLAVDAVARLIRRDSKAISNAIGRTGSDSEAFNRWLDGYCQDTRQIVLEAFHPFAASFASFGQQRDMEGIATAYIQATRSDLESLIKSADQKSDLALMLEGWQGQRSEQLVNNLLGESNEF